MYYTCPLFLFLLFPFPFQGTRIKLLFMLQGCRLHLPPSVLEISFFAPFRPALCHLSSFLTVSEMVIFHFFFHKQHFHRKQKRDPAFLSCSTRPCLFTTRTRMLSRAILRDFLAGNLLACTLGTVLRAVKKPFRASLIESLTRLRCFRWLCWIMLHILPFAVVNRLIYSFVFETWSSRFNEQVSYRCCALHMALVSERCLSVQFLSMS